MEKVHHGMVEWMRWAEYVPVIDVEKKTFQAIKLNDNRKMIKKKQTFKISIEFGFWQFKNES